VRKNVFGSELARTVAQVLLNWDKVKDRISGVDFLEISLVEFHRDKFRNHVWVVNITATKYLACVFGQS